MPLKIKLPVIIKKFDHKLGEIIHDDLEIITEIKKYVIASGGKRIRPLTHYFFCKILDYNGKSWSDVGSIAELIHAASLLHDDVVDGADVRRGKPTIGKLYGNKTAILSGDYLLACGIEHLNKLQNPDLMDSYTEVIRHLSVGELIQMEWERNPEISMVEYEKVIYGKTAALFGAVCETAGILAEKEKGLIKKLKDFGVKMGILFQIKDDYIDYFSDEKDSGKTPAKDFINGLYTYPLIMLKQSISKNLFKDIKKIMQKESRNSEDINFIMNTMESYNIRKLVYSNIQKYAHSMISFLDNFQPSNYRDLMIEKIQEITKY